MTTNSAAASYSLGEILAAWAEKCPDREAFSFLARGEAVSSHLSYLALHRQALAIMRCLEGLRLTGRPVILIYPPGLDYIAAFCGCLYAGVIAVPAPYLLPKRAGQRIAAICRAAEPAAVLTLSTLADLGDIRDAARDLASLPWIATDTLDLQDGDPGAPLPMAPTDPAFLQFTSGSTGTPKGVIVSHGNLMANMAMIRDAFGHDEHTRFVSWLPMFHDMGLVGCVLQPIYLGVSCVAMSPLSFLQKPVRWLQAIARHGGTTSGAPNFAYELCARTIRDGDCEGLDLASWRVAFCGAEPVRPDTLSRFAARTAACGFDAAALYPCYGLSEATLFASGGPPAAGLRTTSVDDPETGQPRLFASSGTGWYPQKIAIVDPDSLYTLADGDIGEIWLAGPHIAQGYWHRPDETEIVFGGRIADGDGTSYLRTGDLGFRRDGELYVTGRLKDLMIVRGAKHMPEDIEATVAECHPALSYGSGAAFTIDDAAETRVIILQEVDRRHLLGLDVDAVIGAAVAAVTGDHGIRPADVRLLRPGLLPRTTSGKIQRHRCREAYLSGAYPALVCTHD